MSKRIDLYQLWTRIRIILTSVLNYGRVCLPRLSLLFYQQDHAFDFLTATAVKEYFLL